MITLDLEAINPEEEQAFILLINKVTNGSVYVEVGSWKGRSASVIGKAVKALGKHLYCVDHWRGSEGTSLIQTAQNQDVYKIFEHNMRALELWDCIIPMVMDSLEASKEFEDNSIDFLFLDADHRYEPFKQDLEAWFPKIKKGGIICGHDCELKYSEISPETKRGIDNNLGVDYIGLYHPGVIKGLFDYFNDDYSIVDNTRIWFKEM